jgi:N-methylhydantoinase A
MLVPATQSVHSALGAASSDIAVKTELAAPMRVSRQQPEVDEDEVEAIFARLEELARETLHAQRVPAERQEFERVVEIRFVRQTKALSVGYRGSVQALLADFLSLYAQRYGAEAVPELTGFELVTMVVQARGRLPRPALTPAPLQEEDPSPARRRSRPVYDTDSGEFRDTTIYDGPKLVPGNLIAGPAVIEYPTTTLAVGSGKRARVDQLQGIEVTAAEPRGSSAEHAEAAVVDQERAGQVR